MGTELLLAALLALIIGAGVGFFLRNMQAQKELAIREKKGDEIISRAKKDASDIKYKARKDCLLYTSPSPRDGLLSRMPSSA